MSQADMEAWLNRGWDWLENPENARNPKYVQAEEAWFKKLGEYEQAYRLAHLPSPRTVTHLS